MQLYGVGQEEHMWLTGNRKVTSLIPGSSSDCVEVRKMLNPNCTLLHVITVYMCLQLGTLRSNICQQGFIVYEWVNKTEL